MPSSMWYRPHPMDGHPHAVGGLLYTDQQKLRREFQWIAFGAGPIADADLEWFGFHVVQRVEPPEVPYGSVLFNDIPELVDGVWYERFLVVPHEPWMPALPPEDPQDPPVDPPVDEPEEPAP